MKAVIAEQIGTWSEVLKITDWPPIEDLPPKALHVQTSACGMGFPDLLQVEGKYQLKAEPPFVPAASVTGKILAIGAEVDPSAFKVGDRVAGLPARRRRGSPPTARTRSNRRPLRDRRFSHARP